jgi:hypothetical protein
MTGLKLPTKSEKSGLVKEEESGLYFGLATKTRMLWGKPMGYPSPSKSGPGFSNWGTMMLLPPSTMFFLSPVVCGIHPYSSAGLYGD